MVRLIALGPDVWDHYSPIFCVELICGPTINRPFYKRGYNDENKPFDLLPVSSFTLVFFGCTQQPIDRSVRSGTI
jgi:hypothetical protein